MKKTILIKFQFRIVFFTVQLFIVYLVFFSVISAETLEKEEELQ